MWTTLLLVGVVAAVVLMTILLWSSPQDGTLEFEVAKTCLQVIGVVVLGGVVAIATSSVEHSRQDQALEEAQAAAHRAEKHQYREESFKVRAALLDRVAQCAAGMYVICRQVERDRASGPAGAGTDIEANPCVLKNFQLLGDRFLSFSAEGLTLQTEIDARFATGSTEGGTGTADAGESSLRWHQVYDLLTLYYFSLVGGFPERALENLTCTDKKLHSGLDLSGTIEDLGAPPSGEFFSEVQKLVRRKYVEVMPLLADSLLNERLSAPAPPPDAVPDLETGTRLWAARGGRTGD